MFIYEDAIQSFGQKIPYLTKNNTNYYNYNKGKKESTNCLYEPNLINEKLININNNYNQIQKKENNNFEKINLNHELMNKEIFILNTNDSYIPSTTNINANKTCSYFNNKQNNNNNKIGPNNDINDNIYLKRNNMNCNLNYKFSSFIPDILYKKTNAENNTSKKDLSENNNYIDFNKLDQFSPPNSKAPQNLKINIGQTKNIQKINNYPSFLINNEKENFTNISNTNIYNLNYGSIHLDKNNRETIERSLTILPND